MVDLMRTVAMGPFDMSCPVTPFDPSKGWTAADIHRNICNNYMNARVLWAMQGALPGDAASRRHGTAIGRLYSAAALHEMIMRERLLTVRDAMHGESPPALENVLGAYTMLRAKTFERRCHTDTAVPVILGDRLGLPNRAISWYGELPTCVTVGKYGTDRPIGLLLQGLVRLSSLVPFVVRNPTGAVSGHILRIIGFEQVVGTETQRYVLITYGCSTASTVSGAATCVNRSLGDKGKDLEDSKASLIEGVYRLALETFGIGSACIPSSVGVWTLSHYTFQEERMATRPLTDHTTGDSKIEEERMNTRLYDYTRLSDAGDRKKVIALRTHAASADVLYVVDHAVSDAKVFPTMYAPGVDTALRNVVCYTRTKNEHGRYMDAIGYTSDWSSIVYFVN